MRIGAEALSVPSPYPGRGRGRVTRYGPRHRFRLRPLTLRETTAQNYSRFEVSCRWQSTLNEFYGMQVLLIAFTTSADEARGDTLSASRPHCPPPGPGRFPRSMRLPGLPADVIVGVLLPCFAFGPLQRRGSAPLVSCALLYGLVVQSHHPPISWLTIYNSTDI